MFVFFPDLMTCLSSTPEATTTVNGNNDVSITHVRYAVWQV